MQRVMRWAAAAASAAAALCLAACGGGNGTAAAPPPDASSGQVSGGTSGYKLSHYAASRFAEQATFGPTPALVAEIRSKGYSQWIDEQFNLPPTQIDVTPAKINGNPIPQEPYQYQQREYQKLILAAPDQLRARVSWSLSQFITVSGRKGHPAGLIDWVNMLQRQSFGRYGDLLYAVSVHPYMAQYLDNNQNRPKSAECPFCAPNENFARELMQLFSLGVVKLNADGTPVRNSRGGVVETYTQTDVEQMARVLTGWQHVPDTPQAPFNGILQTMQPSTWAPERDSGEKRVLGRVFPAGQSAPKDLEDAVDLLMSHQNIAPFVALRLIQHLVKSNPSPAYLGRVAAVFRNNGSGVAGDMKAVVKAVLLDAEARAGDDPAKARNDDGKLREPVLVRSAVFRVLGCRGVPANSPGYWLASQPHLNPESVFSFYAPTDRAPGSNLLAPEQKLLTAAEFTARMGELNWARWNAATGKNDMTAYTAASCQTDPLVKAFTTSPRVFADYLSEHLFRGAMPPTLRSNLEQLAAKPSWDPRLPEDGALRMLGYATATPYFGVIK